jgi:uncharacterized protein (DUF2252 family)
VDERTRIGREARQRVGRSAHGDWEPAADRRDPVAILEEQAQSRVSSLVPLRYGRMLTSPFAFYRGGAAIMAGDLAGGPSTGLNTQLCGDAHLSNFGTFAGPDRRLLFDLNDFDETLPGPFEWDLKRLVASFEIAGRHRGFGAGDRRRITLACVSAYRRGIQRFAGMPTLDVWYARLDLDIIRAWAKERRGDHRALDRYEEKARRKGHLLALSRLTDDSSGEPRFRSQPPLLVPISELLSSEDYERTEELLRKWLRDYRASASASQRVLIDRFRFADLAHKVVGVGSVGTRAWVVLLLGRDASDPLILQVKEAQSSVLERFLGASAYREHGRRVVEGQRLMQAASDIFLGWTSGTGLDGVRRDFYVRQLWDAKRSVDIDQIARATFVPYSELCALTLARAHARSGDAVAIAAYVGASDKFDQALARFAAAYADINEHDYAALQQAAREGRIEVQHEPA